MASKQKERFEILFDSLKAAHHYISEMDKRFAYLRVIEECNVIREEIERNIERCQESLILDIDTDFSYKDMAEDARWRYDEDTSLVVPNEYRSSYPKLKSDVFNDEYFDLAFNGSIAKIKGFDDEQQKKKIEAWKLDGGDDNSKPTYVSTLEVDAFKGIFTSVSSIHKVPDIGLKKIIMHCIQSLRERMLVLSEILGEHPSKQKCINLYNQLTTGMGAMTLKAKAGELYNEWIINKADGDADSVSKDMLNDYKEDVVINIMKLSYITNVKDHNPRSFQNVHRNDIDFEHLCENESSRIQKLYCEKFLSLFDPKQRGKRIEYIPYAHRIGEYMFLSRSEFNQEQRNEFLIQLFLLLKIQNELFGKGKGEQVNSATPDAPTTLSNDDIRIKNAIEYIIGNDVIKNNYDYAMIQMILQQKLNIKFKNGKSFVDYLKKLGITYKFPSPSSINKLTRDAKKQHPEWKWDGLDHTEIQRRNDIATFFLSAYNKNR